ncbi:hepcidin-like [Fundulus heteroclitus]|uniref:Hepcidin-like n=1 Tax=Fundulus heteroclitus TaxID=8078 RepID=A0A3Q2QXD9_FUNHE|nr:hepcidin-like [Fundulus heteroclitus]
MKTFAVAVAVSLMLTFICIQESSAVPAAEGPELMEVLTDDGSLAVDHDMPEDSVNTSYDSVQMRRRRRRCRFCCGCCPNMVGCGTCCKF